MQDNMIAKILRYMVYAAAFVPLIIFSEYISPFHFGKVVIFRSLVEIMAVFYVLLIWKDRSYLPRMTKVGWAFLSFAVAFSITTITSVIPYASFWGSLERMGGLFTFWHYFVFFIILISTFRTEKEWFNLFKLVLGVGILSAFYGFGQKTDWEFFIGSGGRSRIFGTIGNAALFAGYQILNLFLALTLLFREGNSKNMKIFYALTVVVTTITVLMTAVRGSVLAVAVGYLVFALLYTSVYRSKKAKKILLGLIGLFVIFVGASLLLKETSFVKNSGYLRRITDFSFSSYTVQTRFWAWEAGLKGWKEEPKTILLGWGPENFNIPFSKYFNPKFFQGPGSETLFDRAHNMFVEILVTMGLAGFLTYLWIFGVSLQVLWRKIYSKDTMLYGVGLIPLLIAYAIHNSFIFDTSANFLVFFTILGFISFLAAPKVVEDKKSSRQPIKSANGFLWSFTAFVLFAAAAVGIYFINIQPARANYTLTRAIVAGWSGDFAGAIEKYKEAISYDVPGRYEYRNRFAQYILEQTASGKISAEVAEIINLVILEVQKNIDENPGDYLPYLYKSRLYITLGKSNPDSEYNDLALQESFKALELSPTFVRTYYEIGQAYLNKKDLDKAVEYFKKAAELNPDVGQSHWYWGIIEVERGNIGFGLNIIENAIKSGIYAPSADDLKRLAEVYVSRNDFQKTAWVFEILVRTNPKDPQYQASLAVTYARIGKIEEAIQHAREAARLDPKFEAEARAFVQSLGYQW